MIFPPDRKLDQQQLEDVCLYLMRNKPCHTPGVEVIMRNLRVISKHPSSPVLDVNPMLHRSYTTYFWWTSMDKNGNRYAHKGSKEEVYQYWMSILTSLNEAPDLILSNHVKTRKSCLYYYRIPNSTELSK